MRRGWWAGIACMSLLLGCAREPVSISVHITHEEPGPSVAEALERHLQLQDVDVVIVPREEPDQILTEVRDGIADFGIVEEPAERLAGLTTVAPLYPSILHVLHRKERVVKNFPDLIRGQRIYAGPIGGTAWRLLTQLADDFMLPDAEFTILPNPWVEDPDVYFILGGLLADDALLNAYELYSFGDAERLGFGTQAEGLALKFPNIHPFILPDAVYGSFNDEPILTLATRTVLVARDDLDADLAYRIARELFEHAHAIAAEYHLVMSELNHKLDVDSLALPLHRGARTYIEKDEPTLIERYAEVVGVALTIAAALGSGLLAALRVGKARRKDRIDGFYTRVMALRHELEDAKDINSINSLKNKVKAVQEQVFELLIAERLNVDASLTVFLEFSNRVLGEIDERRESQLQVSAGRDAL